MLRSFWLLIRISFLIGLIIWIAERPGKVTIEWLDYTIRIQVGFFLLLLLGIVIFGIVTFSLIKGILDIPVILKRYSEYKNRIRGLRALTLGLSAVAAGDGKVASIQAARAKRYLPKKEALPCLLEAQAARLQGDETKAVMVFKELVQHKDASFLGIRGLLHSSLENGDHESALELSRRALKNYPKQGWVLQIVYDLEIKMRNWSAADKTLVRVENAGLFSRDKAKSDRIAMIIAQALDAKAQKDDKQYYKLLLRAHGIDKKFVPAVVMLSRLYLLQGKRRAAMAMIGDAWRNGSHPDLIALWEEALPQTTDDKKSITRIHWFERLLSLNPNNAEGMQALAKVLMQEGLWGDARKYLEKAESIRPSVSLYKLWASLEDRATGNQQSVKYWLEKAADAPQERVWICGETGRVYDEWSPVSDQGLFNTVIWDFPLGRAVNENVLSRNQYAQALLGAI